MLSLVEKISKTGPPWDDVVPIVRSLIEAAPDRVVWANDWPHPVSESVFRGMASAVIHNSDYASVNECESAIGRYFR